jgi:PAS domain S-box-containing protein
MFSTALPYKILLVEDNDADARFVHIQLSESGLRNWQLKHRDSLAGALQALGEERFAAVLLDLSLPDSRGIETLEKLVGQFPDTNIIVLSGQDDAELAIETVKSGAQDYLVKGAYSSGDLAKSLRYSIERRRITQSLEETQRIAHIGNIEYDLDSRTLTYSDESASILGIPPKATKMTMSDLYRWFAAEDVQKAIELAKEAVRLGEVRSDIQFIRPTDRQTRHIFALVRAHRSEDGTVVRLSGVIQDITDRKLAEQEVIRGRERYRHIFSQSKDAIFITTRAGEIVDFNHAALKLFGFDEAEMAAANARELYLHPEQRTALIEKIDQNDFVQDFHIDIRLKTGEIRQCLISANRMRTDGLDGYQGMLRDITEERQTEELQRAKLLAEKASAMKEQFLANVSHEIRTPLNAISGLTHLLQKTRLDEEQFNFADSIRQATDSLLKIINDILEISQIQSGQIQLAEKKLNPAALVRGAVQMLKYKAEEKQLRLFCEILPDTEMDLLGDPTRLNQILLNLVNNAIKFTDRGEVAVRLSKEHETEETVFLAFSVQDTGEGISEDKLDTIFDMFVQVSDDLNKKQGGSGLGLAIVQQLTELQGGRVEVHSQKNRGSVFTVRLPLRRPTASSDTGETAVGPPIQLPDRPIGILLVEDQKMNQLVAKKIIEGEWANVQVTIANNGREALELFEKKHFDLIIMDIQMPEMDGYETTEFIRKRFAPPKSQVPILAMTAHAFISKEEKYRDFGMDDFVLKPFVPQQLFQKIAQYVNPRPQVPLSAMSIDLAYLHLVANGDPATKAELLQILLEETPVEIQRMERSLEAGHWEELKQYCHKMKSTLAFAGCAPLCELNIALESLCSRPTDDLEKMASLIQQLSAGFEQIRPGLQAALASL